MRPKVLVGNWKMHKTREETKSFVLAMNPIALDAKNHGIIVGIAPSFLSLETAIEYSTDLLISAQNCHFADFGAFTGEVSTAMLSDLNVPCCLVGHSERRQYFNETNQTCNLKIKKLNQAHITPLYCVGETLAEYEAGTTKDVIKVQLEVGLDGVEGQDVAKMIIAYEPVWSIGTGKNASSAIAQDICAFIRSEIKAKYGNDVAQKVIIQYGGSVKPENVKEYLQCLDVDGALVGGASLTVESFTKLVDNLKGN